MRIKPNKNYSLIKIYISIHKNLTQNLSNKIRCVNDKRKLFYIFIFIKKY